METQDVDGVVEQKTNPCTIWGSDQVLTYAEEIINYKSMLKEVVINNLLIGTISDDGVYRLNKDLKRDLMRMQKGVADESPRYYLAYATLLDKTFHFSISIDDLNEKEVIATLYLTESVQDYPYLESVRTFVASVMLPNYDLKARIYKTFNLVDTIPDNNDDKLIQNLLLRMLEIVNQAAPSSAVEEPHDTPKVEQTEVKDDKKPAAKPEAKSAAKPTSKPAAKKANNKKPDKKKDDKKKEQKLEDLLGKKYAPFKPAVSNIKTIEINNDTFQLKTESNIQPQSQNLSPSGSNAPSKEDNSRVDDVLVTMVEVEQQFENTENHVIINEGQNSEQNMSEQIKVDEQSQTPASEQFSVQTEVSVQIEEDVAAEFIEQATTIENEI